MSDPMPEIEDPMNTVSPKAQARKKESEATIQVINKIALESTEQTTSSPEEDRVAKAVELFPSPKQIEQLATKLAKDETGTIIGQLGEIIKVVHSNNEDYDAARAELLKAQETNGDAGHLALFDQLRVAGFNAEEMDRARGMAPSKAETLRESAHAEKGKITALKSELADKAPSAMRPNEQLAQLENLKTEIAQLERDKVKQEDYRDRTADGFFTRMITKGLGHKTRADYAEEVEKIDKELKGKSKQLKEMEGGKESKKI